jgi:hypothetical protein
MPVISPGRPGEASKSQSQALPPGRAPGQLAPKPWRREYLREPPSGSAGGAGESRREGGRGSIAQRPILLNRAGVRATSRFIGPARAGRAAAQGLRLQDSAERRAIRSSLKRRHRASPTGKQSLRRTRTPALCGCAGPGRSLRWRLPARLPRQSAEAPRPGRACPSPPRRGPRRLQPSGLGPVVRGATGPGRCRKTGAGVAGASAAHSQPARRPLTIWRLTPDSRARAATTQALATALASERPWPITTMPPTPSSSAPPYSE